MSNSSTQTIPGWKNLRDAIVDVDGRSFSVTYGTVDDGTLKGEDGVALINGRAPWRFDDATRNKIQKEVLP